MKTIHRVALLEPSVASECVVTEMMGQIRCGAPFLAGALAAQGFEARVFAEELLEFTPDLMDRLARNYDAVGLSLALNTLPRGLQVARALKRRRPDLPIVVGGASASAYADRFLGLGEPGGPPPPMPGAPHPLPVDRDGGSPPHPRGMPHDGMPPTGLTPREHVQASSRGQSGPGSVSGDPCSKPQMAGLGTTGPADAVLKGRAETTLPALLQAWNRGEAAPALPGLIVRQGESLRRFPGQPEPGDGPTRYDLVEGFGPLTMREGMFGAPKPAVYSLFASTGCVRACRFCKSEKRYLMRSHDRVITDLQMLLDLHAGRGLARFMLVDDCLFGDLDWTKELLRRIAHTCRGHQVSFSAQFHVKPTQDDELMRLFAEARFTSLAIGFESTFQPSLDGEHKGTTVAHNDRAIEQCRRFGIVPYGYFVVGFDTDTADSVRQVFDYILERRLVAQVLPVGIMNRDEDGQPTADADRVLSDTSFGATVYVSHRPRTMSAAHLQQLINVGWARTTSLRRLLDFATSYERQFLIGGNRCFGVWHPAMEHHVQVLKGLDPR